MPEPVTAGDRHRLSKVVGLGVVVPILVLTVTGVAGGALWAWWADPPTRAELTQQNVEIQLGQVFGVELRYAAVALALGAVVGVLLTISLRWLGWPLVLGVALGGLGAAAASYWLGVWWGPPPAAGFDRDSLLSGALAITVPGLFLSWPAAAVAACWITSWALDRDRGRSSGPALPELPPPHPRSEG